MLKSVSVHMLPALVDLEKLAGSSAVMIDVLRASTTIVHALASGARAVVPTVDVSDARKHATNTNSTEIVLGGEREGTRIDGFDLDNSPLKYTPEAVGDKTVVFTTTNGTRALLKVKNADRVFIGAFVNLDAVIGRLASDNHPVHLVCAGTRGQVSADDILCAGAIAAGIQSAKPDGVELNDQAEVAAAYFGLHSQSETALYNALVGSRGGSNLIKLGFDADIRCAAKRSQFDIVPEYSADSGLIEAKRASKSCANSD